MCWWYQYCSFYNFSTEFWNCSDSAIFNTISFIWDNVITPTLNTPTVITPTLITPTVITPTLNTPTVITPTLITPTIITPTLNTSTVTDSLCNSGTFNNLNAVRDCPFNLKEEAWFLSRSRKFFSYAALLFLKLFSAAQQNIFYKT